MSTINLETGFNIEVDFAVAPFHRRMFAWCIDILVMYFYNQVLSRLFHTSIGKSLNEKEWIYLLFNLPILFYYPVSEFISNGRTIGKQLMGIRVITTEGGQASMSQYGLRWIFRFIDFPIWIFLSIFSGELPWWSSVFLLSGIACVIFSEKSQRIGDIIAGTIVIYTRHKSSWRDTVFTEVETGYKPLYPQVMKLSDKDINSLKAVIENTRKTNNHDLAFRIAERIKSKFQMQTSQDAIDFLETLLKDYNYYSAV